MHFWVSTCAAASSPNIPSYFTMRCAKRHDAAITLAQRSVPLQCSEPQLQGGRSITQKNAQRSTSTQTTRKNDKNRNHTRTPRRFPRSSEDQRRSVVANLLCWRWSRFLFLFFSTPEWDTRGATESDQHHCSILRSPSRIVLSGKAHNDNDCGFPSGRNSDEDIIFSNEHRNKTKTASNTQKQPEENIKKALSQSEERTQSESVRKLHCECFTRHAH